MGNIQEDIIKQNESLEIPTDTKEVILKPIYKTGPRDRDTTIWMLEVNPKYYKKFEDTTVYLGFMRCRVSAHEEATQCHLCLRYGHPAAKCNETQCVCAHCARKGHKSAYCPASEGDPTCSNCRGKHSAKDKTCSARTAYILGQLRRTDYGIAQ